MKYGNVRKAKFIERLNRFEALVEIESEKGTAAAAWIDADAQMLQGRNAGQGTEEIVHVKNTGRCREILLPGTEVILEKSDNPNRKTRYDLIAAYKKDFGVINIDSQAPNKVAFEWLKLQGYDLIKPEYVYGKSRIDFYMEKGNEKYLMEVKGCTLERDGIGYFPDAPTERGVKHIHELAGALKDGFHCAIAFVIGMNGITEVRPNDEIQPEFGQALAQAKDAGVEVIFVPCRVTEDEFAAI